LLLIAARWDNAIGFPSFTRPALPIGSLAYRWVQRHEPSSVAIAAFRINSTGRWEILMGDRLFPRVLDRVGGVWAGDLARSGGTRGENGMIISDRPKAYRRQKWIRSDSCRIWSRIWLVFNGYWKGYGFTNIRPYPKIYHISRLYADNIRQYIWQWVVEYVTEVKT
jgi:hypothetical protein